MELPGGIWFVDFARAGGAADATRLLAHAVDVRSSDPLAGVSSRLRQDSSLLVLDACEHVLGEAARMASTLLAACPGVRILATSRESLHVTSEERLPVEPLGAAAVKLFMERRASRSTGPWIRIPARSPSRPRWPDASEGLPLALELAAAHVNVLALAEIAWLLEQRATLLHESPTPDPARLALQALGGLELRPAPR